MKANPGQAIDEFLSQCEEPLPNWLASDKPTFDRKNFFGSRTVYYPGSGCDGHPVKLCALSHAAHTFVYVDQAVNCETIVELLGDREQGFRGYEILCQQRINEDVLRPGGWSPHVRREEVLNSVMFASDFAEPFGLFVVLERKDDYCEKHGPRRLAILFIGADGFASYDALYCQEDGTPPPYMVVVQDSGFGGNFDRFDKGGLLERIARKCNVLPKCLLVGETSKEWTCYKDTGACPEFGGHPPSPRRLFCRDCK